ncbi:reverse transcriptase domain-containing protein [Tanacetum coccineum]
MIPRFGRQKKLSTFSKLAIMDPPGDITVQISPPERFGAPRAIICDRGTHFCNDQFAKVLLKYGSLSFSTRISTDKVGRMSRIFEASRARGICPSITRASQSSASFGNPDILILSTNVFSPSLVHRVEMPHELFALVGVTRKKEQISKKKTKNKAKATKPDTEWKSVEKTQSSPSPKEKKKIREGLILPNWQS